MKPVPCPVPVTHALEAWAFNRAARSLNLHARAVFRTAGRAMNGHEAENFLRAQAAKYQALAEKERANVRGAAGAAL